MTAFKVIEEFVELERQILQRGNEISPEEAHKFHDCLDSCLVNFSALNLGNRVLYPAYLGISNGKSFQNKIIQLQTHLRRFFEPVDESISTTKPEENNSIDESTETDHQTETADSLDSLLQKQKFYIQMIDSLAPEGELTPKKAELRYEHISQIYVWFMSNQSNIMTIVKDSDFEDQVEISKGIQRKVLSLQETMKEIFSPMKSTVLSVSKVEQCCNQTDRPNFIRDFLKLDTFSFFLVIVLGISWWYIEYQSVKYNNLLNIFKATIILSIEHIERMQNIYVCSMSKLTKVMTVEMDQ